MTDLNLRSVSQLLNDIEDCTSILSILPRWTGRTPVAEAECISLPYARQLLSARQVKGMQFRYRYQGSEWWDTLIESENGYRVVRIRHLDTINP